MILPDQMPIDTKEFYLKNIDKPHITNVPKIPQELLNDGHKGNIAKWIMHSSGLPTLLLDVEVPHKEMLAEALANDHLFVKHRGTDSPGWSSMAVHGTAVEDTSPREALIKQGKYTEENAPNYHWTELADSCPVTKSWVESLGFSLLKRVRFMKLDPGGWITPHKDTDVIGIQAWNISINNPDGHLFCIDGFGFVPWKPGQMRGIDIGKKHTVVNTGTEPRIHMIIHGHHGNKFTETLVRSYNKLYDEFNS